MPELFDLNGFGVPVAVAQARRTIVQRGARSHSARGQLRDGRRGIRRQWDCTTKPLSADDATALEGLLEGFGHRLLLADGLHGSTGLAPESYTGVLVDPVTAGPFPVAAGRLDVSAGAEEVARWDAQLDDREWTIVWWELAGSTWTQYARIGDGRGFDGSTLDATTGTVGGPSRLLAEVLQGQATLTKVDGATLTMAHVVLLPWRATAAMIAAWSAASLPFGPLPAHRLTGQLIQEDEALVLTEVTRSDFVQMGTADVGDVATTPWENAGRVVSFRLSELDETYKQTVSDFVRIELPPEASSLWVAGLFTGSLTVGGDTLVGEGGTDAWVARIQTDGTVDDAVAITTPQDVTTPRLEVDNASDRVYVAVAAIPDTVADGVDFGDSSGGSTSVAFKQFGAGAFSELLSAAYDRALVVQNAQRRFNPSSATPSTDASAASSLRTVSVKPAGGFGLVAQTLGNGATGGAIDYTISEGATGAEPLVSNIDRTSHWAHWQEVDADGDMQVNRAGVYQSSVGAFHGAVIGVSPRHFFGSDGRFALSGYGDAGAGADFELNANDAAPSTKTPFVTGILEEAFIAKFSADATRSVDWLYAFGTGVVQVDNTDFCESLSTGDVVVECRGTDSSTCTFDHGAGSTAVTLGGTLPDLAVARYLEDGSNVLWAKGVTSDSTNLRAFARACFLDETNERFYWGVRGDGMVTLGTAEPNAETIDLGAPASYAAALVQWNLTTGAHQWSQRITTTLAVDIVSVTALNNRVYAVVMIEGNATFDPGGANETIITHGGDRSLRVARYTTAGVLEDVSPAIVQDTTAVLSQVADSSQVVDV